MSASFNFDEINTLAADLGQVARSTVPNVRKAVEVSSRRVKDTWRGKLKGSLSLVHLPNAVTYDVESAAGEIVGEVGFDKSRKQGPLGNISEYGTPSTPGRGFGLAALAENQDDFVHGIGIALGDTLKDAAL